MEWTGAGVVPRAKIGGEHCLLLGHDREGWCGLGGIKAKNEPVSLTAARQAFEESGGVLGTTSEIQRQIRSATVEKIQNGPFRLFITNWSGSDTKAIPTLFQKSDKGGITELAWVKANEIYRAIAEAQPGTNDSIIVDGKTLRGRFVGNIRKSCLYQAFLDKHPKLAKGSCAWAGIEIHSIFMGVPASRDVHKDGLRRYVVLKTPTGKPGKTFRVNSAKGEIKDWDIEEMTDVLNPKHERNMVQKGVDVLRRSIFDIGGVPPSSQERLAIWHAVNGEGVLPRLRHWLFDLRCSGSLLTAAERKMVEAPLGTKYSAAPAA